MFTDVGNIDIHQLVITKEQDLSDPFNVKTSPYAYIWLENIEQDVIVRRFN